MSKKQKKTNNISSLTPTHRNTKYLLSKSSNTSIFSNSNSNSNDNIDSNINKKIQTIYDSNNDLKTFLKKYKIKEITQLFVSRNYTFVYELLYKYIFESINIKLHEIGRKLLKEGGILINSSSNNDKCNKYKRLLKAKDTDKIKCILEINELYNSYLEKIINTLYIQTIQDIHLDSHDMNNINLQIILDLLITKNWLKTILIKINEYIVNMYHVIIQSNNNFKRTMNNTRSKTPNSLSRKWNSIKKHHYINRNRNTNKNKYLLDFILNNILIKKISIPTTFINTNHKLFLDILNNLITKPDLFNNKRKLTKKQNTSTSYSIKNWIYNKLASTSPVSYHDNYANSKTLVVF